MHSPIGTCLLAALSLTFYSASAQAAESADSTRMLDEVIVTGTSSPTQAKLLPYTVSVVNADKLEASGHSRVLSVISGMVPSLFVTERSVFGFGVSSSGGSGHIKLRGVGGDRASGVLMMVDGQPQFAGIYSHHIADFYGKENVERVEVLRGPGSVLYGSNAMAGAINVITRSATDVGVHTSLTTQYGSYNTWLSSLTNTVHIGRLSTLASLSYNRTDGVAGKLPFRQTEGYAKATYSLSDHWRATADFTLMHLRSRDAIYPTLSNPESTDVYVQNITRGEASLTATNSYNILSGAARAYYSYGNHFVDDPRHFHSKDDRWGIIIYQSFSPWRDATATAGFDFDSYAGEIPMSGGNNHTPGALATMERKSITEYSPYITLSQSLASGIVTASAGLRMANSNMFHTQWVPQAGCAVNPGHGLTLKANVAMGYRNPSFRELYLYRMANPLLQPEKMMNYEVSVAKSLSRLLTIDLTAYYSRGSNLIQTLDMKNQNTGSFINKGIEVSAGSRPVRNLHLYATYSYLHTSLQNLTGAPRQQYYLGAEWQPVKQLNIAADLKGVVSLYVSEEIDRQNYALLNLKIDYDFCRYASIFTRLENITATRYVINRGYEMPGFTALGGIKLHL